MKRRIADQFPNDLWGRRARVRAREEAEQHGRLHVQAEEARDGRHSERLDLSGVSEVPATRDDSSCGPSSDA